MPRGENEGQQFALFMVILQALAAPWALFTRVPGTPGKRYFQAPALIAMLFFVPLIVTACPPKTASEMTVIYGYWVGMPVALVLHGMTRTEREKKGLFEHTRYLGTSWFQWLKPNLSLSTCRALELFPCIGICAVLAQFSECVAVGVAVTYAADFFAAAFADEAEDRRREAVRDAMLDAQFMNDRIDKRFER